jgi:hypothetical protein
MRKKILYLLPLLFILSLSGVRAAETCDITVNPGQNIQSEGLDKATSGQTVCVKQGVYNVDKIKITKKGMSVISHPDNSTFPVLKNNSAYTKDTLWFNLFSVEADNVLVDGFEIASSPGRGFVVNSVSNVVAKNIIVHDTYSSGVFIYKSDNIEVDTFEVYRVSKGDSAECRNNPTCNAVNSNHPESVAAVDSNNITMTNMAVYNVWGGTFATFRSKGITLKNSIIYDAKRSLVHLDQASFVNVENNLAYISSKSGEFNSRTGLVKYDEVYSTHRTFTGESRVIKNNIFINMRRGIDFGGCEVVGPGGQGPTNSDCFVKNDIISNNTVLNISEANATTLRFKENKVAGTNTVSNNIFHHLNTNRIYTSTINSGINFGSNIWSSKPAGLSGQTVENQAQIKTLFKYPDKAFNKSNHLPGKVDPLWFELKDEYKQYGADVTKVGPKTDTSNTTPTPTPDEPTPTPDETTPTPKYDIKYDLNNDSKINVSDIIELIKYVFQ